VDNVRRHQQLIDNDTNIEESQKDQERVQEQQFEVSIEEIQRKRKKECAKWLSPTDIDTTKNFALCAKTPGTCEWILNTRKLQA